MVPRAHFAWLVLPVGLLAWPLVARQQEKRDAEVDSTDPEFAPLVSELPARGHPTAASFVVKEKPESWPRLVADPVHGRTWLVAVQWEPGIGDSFVVRSLAPDGSADVTVALGDDVREVVQPAAAVDGAGRLVVAWTETTERGPVLRATRLDAGKFAPIATLTDPAQAAHDVALCTHDGRVWFAFESWTPPAPGSERGNVDVLLAPLDPDGGRLGAATAVGAGRFTDLDPALASGGGKLWTAWSRYEGRDYEVYLRSFDPATGTLGAPLDVSADAQSDDLHPALAATADGALWLAWDRIVDPGRGSSVPRTYVDRYADAPCGAHVVTAFVRGESVLLPEGRRGLAPGVVVGAPQFSWTGGLPRIELGADGRPWLAYRYLAKSSPTHPYGYGVVAHHWIGAAAGADGSPRGGWSAPIAFDASLGTSEEPALLATGGGALVAWERRNTFGLYATMPDRDLKHQLVARDLPPEQLETAVAAARVEARSWMGESSLCVARLQDGEAAAAEGAGGPDAKLVARAPLLAPPHFHPSADPVDDPYVNGAAHFEIARGATKWKAFFGDLHRHSCVSRCSGGMEERPLQRWQLGRDVHDYDFMALTDHAGQVDPISFWLEDKLVRQQRAPDFVALAGYEWSSVKEGHQNVILAGRMAPILKLAQDLPSFYAELGAADAITIPHGTADRGRSADVPAWDEQRVRLVEVFQSLRGSSEFDGCWEQSQRATVADCFVQDALAAGHKFGLVASSDHGNGCAYAVALAERLDVASLFEAFRARRTYAATTKGMLIDFRVDDHVMGEECACTAPPKLHVKARGAAELAELVIFRDRGVFATVGRAVAKGPRTPDRRTRVTVSLELPPPGTAPVAADWTLALDAPDCELIRAGSAGPYHHNHPEMPFARWKVQEKRADFICPAAFATDPHDLDYRVVVAGALDAKVAFTAGGEQHADTLAGLIAHPFAVDSPRGAVRITAMEPPDAAIDLAKGLGVRELEADWSDAGVGAGAHWYYARAIQVDGEVMWSSPIFVDRR